MLHKACIINSRSLEVCFVISFCLKLLTSHTLLISGIYKNVSCYETGCQRLVFRCIKLLRVATSVADMGLSPIRTLLYIHNESSQLH